MFTPTPVASASSNCPSLSSNAISSSITSIGANLFAGTNSNLNVVTDSSTSAMAQLGGIANASASQICFRRDTKILSLVNDEEKYIPIQNLVKGSLVKTVLNSYLPVSLIGKRNFNNVVSHDKRIKERVYKCSTQKYPELFEDLIITGANCLLKNKITKQQMRDTNKINNTNKQTPYLLDGKCKLMVCVDNSAELYNNEDVVEFWTLSLSNSSIYKNYGIYANGLLVESTP
jgi:hypothetical protein